MTTIPFILPTLIVTSTTQVYNYRNSTSSISAILMGSTLPKINAYNMIIYNQSNANVIVQPLTNNSQSVNNAPTPDINIDSSTTVTSGSIVIVVQSAFIDAPLEMLSASLRFKSIPTSGNVYGWVSLYYDY
ncbi:MAG: hypothetical protein QXL94_00060 [Candidatus Parvarchaeum sp.]